MSICICANQTDAGQAYTNCGYVGTQAYEALSATAGKEAKVGKALRCEVKNLVLNLEKDKKLDGNAIALNKLQRNYARIGLKEELAVRPFQCDCPLLQLHVAVCTVEVSLLVKTQTVSLVDTDMELFFKKTFIDHIFTMDQSIAYQCSAADGSATAVTCKISKLEALALGQDSDSATSMFRGIIVPDTEFNFSSDSPGLKIQTKKMKQRNLFKHDFNFSQLGIGGLDKEFSDIFRRAFASRVFPPQIVQEMGITHVRGMLLFGPPGTGKTLIARQIGKALRAREPKVVNGPEVLNKFVGQSEENIRALFKDAEDEQKKSGDNSSLHIIIFDELDAICKQRGSTPGSAGVNDSIVNQLLSKIDGVDALNNILLIGMTNRLDLIDEALLRPGRLEVHVEIGLPDEPGRLQIFQIHTKSIREAKRLGPDVDLNYLAARAKNFSGAEIAGLVRSAASYAFSRNVDVQDLSKTPDIDSIQVMARDFEAALNEVKPAFGVQEDAMSKFIKYGIIDYSTEFSHLKDSLTVLAAQVKHSDKTPLVSMLLNGPRGSGKSALAVHIAQQTLYPFVKVITPDDLIGYNEYAKLTVITKAFDDAYKSPLSVVILDNIERLLEYTAIGPRFSNIVLQGLLVLIKRPPKKEGRKLVIIGTTSEQRFLKDCGLNLSFHVNFDMPMLHRTSHVKAVLGDRKNLDVNIPNDQIDQICKGLGAPIGVKQLLMVAEMAAEYTKPGPVTAPVFISCLNDCGFT